MIKRNQDILTKCFDLPPNTVFSVDDSLHDLLYARIDSLRHTESTVRKYIDSLSRKFLGISDTQNGYNFPNSLIACLSALPDTLNPEGRPVSWIKTISGLEHSALEFFLQIKKQKPHLFPNILPYLKTFEYDHAKFVETNFSVFEQQKKTFNHFKISDDSGGLSGILKTPASKNELGRRFLYLKVGNTDNASICMINDGAHAGVDGKGLSGLSQVIHCMTQATVSDSSPQSPLFPRPTKYIAVGTPDENRVKFLAVDPENIPFCTDNGIMIWFETIDAKFTSKIQDFEIVVFDSERQITLRYNLRDIGQGPSVSDIMSFLYEIINKVRDRTSPPKHHLNMLNCRLYRKHPDGTIEELNGTEWEQYKIVLLCKAVAVAFKGMGDASQIEALEYLMKFGLGGFRYFIFVTCDRLCALDAYLKGIPTALVYGTTVEIFIPKTDERQMTDEEIEEANKQRDYELMMMVNAEKLSIMLSLIEQLEGQEYKGFSNLIQLIGNLDQDLRDKIVTETHMLTDDATKALALAEVDAIHRLVYNCIENIGRIDNPKLVFDNLEQLKSHAERQSQDTKVVYTECEPQLKSLNTFNQSVRSLFSNKLPKNTPQNISSQLVKACQFTGWFSNRTSFTPFGFNGSMYGNLSAGLVKLDRVNISSNERFIKTFVSDVKNLGLHRDIKYFIDRFSELKDYQLHEVNGLLDSLCRIKEITDKRGVTSVLTEIKSCSLNVSTAIKTRHTSTMEVDVGSAGNQLSSSGGMSGSMSGSMSGGMSGGMMMSNHDGGGKTVKSSRKHKHKSMKGGTVPNEYQRVELHRIYHNLSFKICILLTKFGINMDSDISLLDIVSKFKETFLDPVNFNMLYDDFMAIVSIYTNELLDLELSPLYIDYVRVYDYEEDLATLVLIRNLFNLFDPQSNFINPINALFILPVQKLSNAEQIETGIANIRSINKISEQFVLDETIIIFLTLAFIIQPYEANDSYKQQHNFATRFKHALDDTDEEEKVVPAIIIHRVNNAVAVYTNIRQELFHQNVADQTMSVLVARKNQADPDYIDINGSLYDMVKSDNDYLRLKSFIHFYINNNPDFKSNDKSIKILEIDKIINQIIQFQESGGVISPGFLVNILMDIYNAFTVSESFKSTASGSSVESTYLDRYIRPYLYCYYTKRIETWSDLQQCYYELQRHIKSSSADSVRSESSQPIEHNTEQFSTPQTSFKSRQGAAGGGAAVYYPDFGQRSDSGFNFGSGAGFNFGSGAGFNFGSGAGFNFGSGAGSTPGSTPGSGLGFGGASRRRRNFRKNSRSKHSNKKRSYKNKNINTKKYRKLQSKIKYTIKRRKSRRNNRHS